MSFFSEFKTFAMKGNVVDMATGIVIGAAFGKIVSSLVDNVIMPPIGVLIGGIDFSSLAVNIGNPVADAKGAKPVARLVAHAAHAQEPKDFTVAPVGAINKLLAKTGWSIDDVDLFEVNEAFACVAMFAMHDLGIPREKINVHGGATALGHPIGASGTRIITTLIAALQRHGKTRGVASLCIGGGEATAVAVELV